VGKPLAGEVVVLPFPQTNLQAGKRRPALVVAELTGDDVILCQITRQARSDNYSVALTHADFERGRLAEDSRLLLLPADERLIRSKDPGRGPAASIGEPRWPTTIPASGASRHRATLRRSFNEGPAIGVNACSGR